MNLSWAVEFKAYVVDHWNPRSDFNAQFCEDIQNEFIAKNGFDMFVKVGGLSVLPVNACWA